LSTKLLRQYEKESLLEYAQQFVRFFNVEDPVENFRNYPDFAKIAQDEKALATLREAFNQVREAFKGLIIAYEDFWQKRTQNPIETLKEAAARVNALPTWQVRQNLEVSNAGNVKTDFTTLVPENEATEQYIDKFAVFKMSSHIENFKSMFARYKEHFPIGVCRYEKCRKFFVKGRKHARFCSDAHATYMRMRIYRKSLQRKKDRKDTPK